MFDNAHRTQARGLEDFVKSRPDLFKTMWRQCTFNAAESDALEEAIRLREDIDSGFLAVYDCKFTHHLRYSPSV